MPFQNHTLKELADLVERVALYPAGENRYSQGGPLIQAGAHARTDASNPRLQLEQMLSCITEGERILLSERTASQHDLDCLTEVAGELRRRLNLL